MPLPRSLDMNRVRGDLQWLVEKLITSIWIFTIPTGCIGMKRDFEKQDESKSNPLTAILSLAKFRQNAFHGAFDTVPSTPGLDNATGVWSPRIGGTTKSSDLCIAFPTGEEVGLRLQLLTFINKWHPDPASSLVLSLIWLAMESYP